MNISIILTFIKRIIKLRYLIEQFKWYKNDYYHLVNSQEFESKKELKQTSYSKDGSYFVITKLDDEIQTTRKGKQRGV